MPVRPGDLTLAHVQAFVDAVVTVDDPAIIDAVLWIFANAKIVAEPSGAATTAAVLTGAVDAAVSDRRADRRHRQRRQHVAGDAERAGIADVGAGTDQDRSGTGRIEDPRSEDLEIADSIPDPEPRVPSPESRRAKAPMIERFEMERMQSTWENVVDYDMSESGVRPLTLRELVAMGFDLDAFLDQPLGYSQSNGTIELREQLAAPLSGRHRRQHRGHQRHVRGQLPRRPEPAAARRRGRDGGAELHAAARRGAQPRRHRPDVPAAAGHRLGAGLGRVRGARSRAGRASCICRIPTTRPARCCPTSAMRRIVDRCATTGTWLLADEVYLGAEIDRPRTAELLGARRSRGRDERPVEGLRDSRRQGRLDGRPAGARSRTAGRSTTT